MPANDNHHQQEDLRLFPRPGQRVGYGLLLAALLLAPLALDTFYLGELILMLIYAVAGVGLMLLVGYTGLASLGHAAFLAIGAYAHAWLLAQGVPLLGSLGLAGLIAATAGALIALPAVRMTGLYLAIATLAFAVIVEQILIHWETVTGGFRGMPVTTAAMFGYELGTGWAFYYLCLAVLGLTLLASANLLRTPTGRAFIAIRESEISAQSLGINLALTKTVAFALSAGFTGLAGALFAHKLGYLAPDAFDIMTSIQLLLMVVVGGLGSLQGAVLGAIFISFLPQLLAVLRDALPAAIARQPGLEPGLFGLILVLVILFEPQGIYGRWQKIRDYYQRPPDQRVKAPHKRQKAYWRTERLR